MKYNRRRLLQALGLFGISGLAGCQGSQQESELSPTEKSTETSSEVGGETESETPSATATEEDGATFELNEEVEKTGDGRLLHVSGKIEATDRIESVTITLDGRREQPPVEAQEEITLDESIPIEGGQTYDITVAIQTSEGDTYTKQLESNYIPISETGIAVDRLVGAHYYPWYEMHGGHENWADDSIETPVLGEYAADEPAVIDQHLTWCLEHGINWLSMSWWGEGSGSDRALSTAITEAEKFDEVEFSILYETTRLRKFDFDLNDERARDKLRSDLQYLEQEYFGEDNYLQFDGRPVIFLYVARELSGNVEAAFESIFDTLDTKPYILADLSFGASLGTAQIASVLDGITSYNPYSARKDIESVFHDLYRQGLETMNLSAQASDVDFVPVIIPGFNDTAIPDSQREDNPILSATPERYEHVCEQVNPHLADSRAVLITSFNEWYENTQIEPSERFGTTYLDITAQQLATGESAGYNPAGKTFSLDFNQTIVPSEVNNSSSDDRQLAFMAQELSFFAGQEQVVAYDIGVPDEEPIFFQGAFGTAQNDGATWRWLGGPTEKASLFVTRELNGVNRAVLRGLPIRSGEISATVMFDGTKTDTVNFGPRELQTFDLNLTP